MFVRKNKVDDTEAKTKKTEILGDYDRYARRVLEDYKKAPVITPPTELSPIFVTAQHSKASIKNLAEAFVYDMIHYEEEKYYYEMDEEFPLTADFKISTNSIQIYEIPDIDADCQGHAAFLYAPAKDYKPYSIDGGKFSYPLYMDKLKKDGWVKLESVKDSVSKSQFAEICLYSHCSDFTDDDQEINHYTLRWADGTYTSKHGNPLRLNGFNIPLGATAVYRTLSPDHPFVANQTYGAVNSVWIKPFIETIPAPFFRWQSVPKHSSTYKPEGDTDLSKYCKIHREIADKFIKEARRYRQTLTQPYVESATENFGIKIGIKKAFVTCFLLKHWLLS